MKEFKKGKANWTVSKAGRIINQSHFPIVNNLWMTKQCAESLAAGLKNGSIEL